MDEEKKYVELFYLVTFTDDQQLFLVPTSEIDDPEMAEVAIPYETPDTRYSLTCYITNLENHMPAFVEMLVLKEYFYQHGLPTA